MSNVRNWASGLGMATLILLAPIIGFAVVVTAEMMTDALARPGAPVVWTVVAGAVGGFCCANTHGNPVRLGWGRKGPKNRLLLLSAGTGKVAWVSAPDGRYGSVALTVGAPGEVVQPLSFYPSRRLKSAPTHSVRWALGSAERPAR